MLNLHRDEEFGFTIPWMCVKNCKLSNNKEDWDECLLVYYMRVVNVRTMKQLKSNWLSLLVLSAFSVHFLIIWSLTSYYFVTILTFTKTEAKSFIFLSCHLEKLELFKNLLDWNGIPLSKINVVPSVSNQRLADTQQVRYVTFF